MNIERLVPGELGVDEVAIFPLPSKAKIGVGEEPSAQGIAHRGAQEGARAKGERGFAVAIRFESDEPAERRMPAEERGGRGGRLDKAAPTDALKFAAGGGRIGRLLQSAATENEIELTAFKGQ